MSICGFARYILYISVRISGLHRNLIIVIIIVARPQPKFSFEQRLTIGMRDLIVVRVDLVKCEKSVTVSAVVNEGCL